MGGASQHGPNKTFGQIHYAKPPKHSLPTKQATCITVDSSSLGFNVTFLYDCSNFDFLKLMLIEHISFNVHHGCFLVMNVNKLLIMAQPIRHFLDAKVGRSEQNL